MASIENESVAAVGEALVTMSHRIRNILQGINGGSHLVELGLSNKDLAVVTKGWEIVKRNQSQISQLMMNLLILSKPYEANRESCDLRKIVERSVKAQAAAYELERVNVSLDLGESECIASVDSQATQLMFENILSVVLRTVRLFTERFCEITVSQCVGEIEVNFGFGGAATLSEPIEEQPVPVDVIEQRFFDIEVEVATKIASGHSGKIVFPADSVLTQRISISIPQPRSGSVPDVGLDS